MVKYISMDAAALDAFKQHTDMKIVPDKQFAGLCSSFSFNQNVINTTFRKEPVAMKYRL